jgi:hypothetical protein
MLKNEGKCICGNEPMLGEQYYHWFLGRKYSGKIILDINKPLCHECLDKTMKALIEALKVTCNG